LGLMQGAVQLGSGGRRGRHRIFADFGQSGLKTPLATGRKLISLLFLPPCSPELNPKENLWDEIREKIFKNYALKSIDAVRAKLEQAILYVERNPKTVKSITSFPYIRKSF
jgi:transposase